ncbi:unnamed protein product [Phytophthora fragariaefolia]|uniref:Unnamed protein product n=1 Tax=Phytophthora fragariaefolia TaxID=1490495 RepID=A0A9W6YLC9_9STRA|nr:unnamed protein product [Phytophthora fragariaefolia]
MSDQEAFRELEVGVDEVYQEAARVFYRVDAGDEQCIGVFGEKTLPFDLHTTADAAWKCLAHTFHHDKYSFSYSRERRKDDSGEVVQDDSVGESFGVEINAPERMADFQIKQVFRRYMESDKIVLAWRSYIDPSEFQGKQLQGFRFVEKGSMVIRQPPTKPHTLTSDFTKLRIWHVITPETLASATGTSSQFVQDLTDFVLGGSSSASTVQMIENMLIEQSRRNGLHFSVSLQVTCEVQSHFFKNSGTSFGACFCSDLARMLVEMTGPEAERYALPLPTEATRRLSSPIIVGLHGAGVMISSRDQPGHSKAAGTLFPDDEHSYEPRRQVRFAALSRNALPYVERAHRRRSRPSPPKRKTVPPPSHRQPNSNSLTISPKVQALRKKNTHLKLPNKYITQNQCFGRNDYGDDPESRKLWGFSVKYSPKKQLEVQWRVAEKLKRRGLEKQEHISHQYDVARLSEEAIKHREADYAEYLYYSALFGPLDALLYCCCPPGTQGRIYRLLVDISARRLQRWAPKRVAALRRYWVGYLAREVSSACLTEGLESIIHSFHQERQATALFQSKVLQRSWTFYRWKRQRNHSSKLIGRVYRGWNTRQKVKELRTEVKIHSVLLQVVNAIVWESQCESLTRTRKSLLEQNLVKLREEADAVSTAEKQAVVVVDTELSKVLRNDMHRKLEYHMSSIKQEGIVVPVQTVKTSESLRSIATQRLVNEQRNLERREAINKLRTTTIDRKKASKVDSCIICEAYAECAGYERLMFSDEHTCFGNRAISIDGEKDASTELEVWERAARSELSKLEQHERVHMQVLLTTEPAASSVWQSIAKTPQRVRLR